MYWFGGFSLSLSLSTQARSFYEIVLFGSSLGLSPLGIGNKSNCELVIVK